MEQVKNIGGIGSILLLAGVIPSAGQVLAFAGFIMLIIAVYKLSQITGQKEIFHNYLIGIILSSLLLFIVFFGIGMAFIFSFRTGLAGLGAGIILAGLFAWIISIISAYFVKKSFEKISQVTGVAAFRTAGKLYFIGSILYIVLIGGVISLVAAAMQIAAFFSLSSALPGKPQQPDSLSNKDI